MYLGLLVTSRPYTIKRISNRISSERRRPKQQLENEKIPKLVSLAIFKVKIKTQIKGRDTNIHVNKFTVLR